MGVAVADEGQHRAAGAVGLHRGREPDLAGAALHLVASRCDRARRAAQACGRARSRSDSGRPTRPARRSRRRWRRSTGFPRCHGLCVAHTRYISEKRGLGYSQCRRNFSKGLCGLSWPLVAFRSLRLRTAPGRRRDRWAATCAARAWRPAAAPIRWCRAKLYDPRRTARSGIHRASWRRPAPAGRASRRPVSRSRKRPRCRSQK